MDCTDIKVVLSGLVDDELDPAARHAAERHLAECAACRDLVGEVEAVNQLIAADTTQLYGRDDLPMGFMDAVLGRTAAEDRRRSAGAWVNWLGWLAAAACLVLAVSAWLTQDGRLERSTQDGPVVISRMEPPAFRPASYLKSSIYDGETSLTDLLAESASESTAEPAQQNEPMLARDDAETLHAASLLLEMLLISDQSSFADIEQIREMAEYDEMLSRLATARSRLSPTDRPAVFAVESVLLRIVNGPLSTDDVQALQETVRDSDLASHLDVMSARGLGKTTL